MMKMIPHPDYARAAGLARSIRQLLVERDNLNSEIKEKTRALMKLDVRPLKEWVAEEAERQNLAPNSVFCRMQRGKYPELQKVNINERTVLVMGNRCAP